MDQGSFEMIRCDSCGTANRVPRERIDQHPHCGKCHAPLPQRRAPTHANETGYVMRCGHCGTKNRISAARREASANCGKCSNPLDVRGLFAPQPMTVTDSDFEPKVLHSPLPVLLFVWAPWCSTCTVVAPQIDQFAAQVLGKVRVCKANVGSHPALGTRLNVLSVPHIFIYDQGRQLESLSGTLDRNQLLTKMAAYVY